MSSSAPSRRTSAVKAAGWTTSGAVASQAIGFLGSIVLTRLLAPADFGLLAMVTVVTGFARVLSDFGLSSALIQAKEVTSEEYSTAFWANLGLGVLLTVLVAAAAPVLAWFYADPRLTLMALVLAGQFAISALGSVHSTRLQRRMAFRSLVLVELASQLLGTIAGVAGAAWGAGPWSLVLRAHAQTLCFGLGVWRAERWLPHFSLDWTRLRRFTSFSASLTGSRVLNYWARNLDNLLIARFFGATDVGLYVRAYSILMQPVSLVTTALGRVMFPALSSMQDDLPRLRSVYSRTLQLIALVTFPAMALLAVSADDFVLVMFGPRWERCIVMVQIFCLLGALQSLGSTAGWIFQATGRADLQLKWSIVATAVMVCSIVAGVWWGSIEAVALCTLIGSGGILLIPAFEVPGRLIDVRLLKVVKLIAGPLACTVLALAVALLVRRIPVLPAGLPRLFAVWLVGGGAFWLVARVSRQPALAELQAQLSNLVRRVRPQG